MALTFLGAPFVFNISSSEFHQVKLPWIHRQWWVAPNSLDLSPMDHHVWGKCWSLNTSCNRSFKAVTNFSFLSAEYIYFIPSAKYVYTQAFAA